MYNEILLTIIAAVNVANITWLYFDTVHMKHEIKRLQIELQAVKG